MLLYVSSPYVMWYHYIISYCVIKKPEAQTLSDPCGCLVGDPHPHPPDCGAQVLSITRLAASGVLLAVLEHQDHGHVQLVSPQCCRPWDCPARGSFPSTPRRPESRQDGAGRGPGEATVSTREQHETATPPSRQADRVAPTRVETVSPQPQGRIHGLGSSWRWAGV